MDLGLAIISSHLLGDFLLQNDYMAEGKRRSSWICTLHVACYMAGFTVLTLVGQLTWWQWAAIAVEHWLQDRTPVVSWFFRVSGKRNFMQPPLAPWSIIVVDNSIHLVWITLVVCLFPAI